MITKPQGYDEAETRTGGEYEQLPAGAYICIIRKAKEVTSKTGKQMLELWLDIAEGEYKDYFDRIYREQSKQYSDVSWKGIYRQLTEGASVPYFKGMITKIEESNKPYKFDWKEESLKGKRIGGVFGREQYQAQDGTLKFFTKCQYTVSTNKVNGITPPEDKLLKISTSSYPPTAPSYSSAPKFEEINTEDDLPF